MVAQEQQVTELWVCDFRVLFGLVVLALGILELQLGTSKEVLYPINRTLGFPLLSCLLGDFENALADEFSHETGALTHHLCGKRLAKSWRTARFHACDETRWR